jgi:UDP-2,3-diacylglucosamine pyrophosphatase LpxH
MLTLIVSDLHIASGRNPATGKWSPLEDFHADHAFAHLLAHYHDADPDAHLILNGDTFDLVQVAELPSPDEIAALVGSSHLDRDRLRYGLGHSSPEICWKLNQVAAGHPPFFGALAEWILHRHHIHFILGNHDPELRDPAAQSRLVELIAQTYDDLDPTDVQPYVHFHAWYLYQPDQRLYIEHGGQYDPLCYVDGNHLPSCYFTTRYLFNLLETRTPEADNIIPFTHYVSWLLSTDTIPTATVLLRQLPDFLRARRRDRDLLGLLPPVEPPDPRLPQDVEDIIRQAAADQRHRVKRHTRRTGLLTIAAVFLNLAGHLLPLAAVALALTGRPVLAILALAFWPLSHAASASIINTYLHRSIILEINFAETAAHEYAPALADCQVSTVVFGHTHQPDLAQLPRGLRYFNTGTWMPLFCSDTRLERRDQARLFVEVRNGQPRLLQWNDAVYQPQPPIIIDRLSSPRYATRRLSAFGRLGVRRAMQSAVNAVTFRGKTAESGEEPNELEGTNLKGS